MQSAAESTKAHTLKHEIVTPFRRFARSLDPSGKQFEQFVRWFLLNDPEWSTQVDRIWLWEEWPHRWGPDCGIDLVFTDKNGETWAVQAKQYAPTTSITKKDVDSFLSESSRAVFQRRLLITTTDLIGRNAKQACEGQEKPVVLHLGWDFDNAEVVYPASYADLYRIQPKPKPTPRPYQERAVSHVVNGFASADRGQLIMACGTGKTFASLWIKERLGAKTALVLLPSLSLLSQTLREWTAAANEPFEVLCVCSDETVGRRGSDEAVSSTSDVAFPVHSDPDEIAKFLGGHRSRIIFSTYQSSALIAEAQKDRRTRTFDLVVADEAHRCAGKVEGSFGTILDPTLIRARKRLFTTATPRTVSAWVKSAAEGRGIEMVGMDDEAVFGRPFHTLSFGAAIQHDPPLLTDYRVIIIGVDDAMIADWIENREWLSLEKGQPIDAETLASQIGLLKAIRDYDIKRAISFHSRVKSAKEFSEDIQNTLRELTEEHQPAGEVWTDYVSGEMPTDQRRRKLAQLKRLDSADRGLLSNARCLSEGVDVPALDGVAFIDPRKSQVDIVQAVGRAIRLSEGKKAGTIVLPVFIENAEDAEASIEASRFKPVWDVLNALRAHDETLGYELDQIRTELGRRPGSKADLGALSKIVIDLPVSVDDSFADSLRTVLVEQTTSSWEFWCGLLEAYQVEHENCRVSQHHRTADGYRLGHWVSAQRIKRDNLSIERKARLDALGFVWDSLEQRWEEGFQHLQAYQAEHGDFLVEATFSSADGYKLGSWVSNQRQMQESLSAERRERLDSIGFVWDVRGQAWEEGFQHLQAYQAEHSDCLVAGSFKTADGFNLGQWVGVQRRRQESLSAERRARLEAIGFVWDVEEQAWEEGFQHLQAYQAEHKDCRVARGFKAIDGYKLGFWVRRQRQTQESLSAERRARLEAIGFVWDATDQAWEEGFQHLQAYQAEHGDVLPAQRFQMADGFKLGSWASEQRKRRDALSAERRARLEALGFLWNPLEQQWEEGFQHLQAYQAEQGDVLVEAKFNSADGYRLGQWVSHQRSNRDSLSADRKSRLDALGFVWDVKEQRWEEGFQALEAYQAEHGDCRVPQHHRTADGYRLGQWVARQRRAGDTLSAERRERLDTLNFIWTAGERKSR